MEGWSLPSVSGRTSSSFDIARRYAERAVRDFALRGTGVVFAGGAIVFFVGMAAAPWVAAGGVIYGIVSIAGGDDWLNKNLDMSGINFINPKK